MKWPSIPPEIETARHTSETGWMGSGSPLAKPWITNMAAHGRRLKIAGESLLTHPIDDQIGSQRIRQPLRFSDKILPGILDHRVGARSARRPGLLLGRNSTDDARSKMLGPLHEQQTQPAGCCVNQHCVARFGQVVFMDEIVRGHPLMRKRRALLKRKIAR